MPAYATRQRLPPTAGSILDGVPEAGDTRGRLIFEGHSESVSTFLFIHFVFFEGGEDLVI